MMPMFNRVAGALRAYSEEEPKPSWDMILEKALEEILALAPDHGLTDGVVKPMEDRTAAVETFEGMINNILRHRRR